MRALFHTFEKLEQILEATGANYLLCIFSFGDLAPEAAIGSLELFSREVMPGLKARGLRDRTSSSPH